MLLISIQRMWRIWNLCSLSALHSPRLMLHISIPGMWRIWVICLVLAQSSQNSTLLISIPRKWRIWALCSLSALVLNRSMSQISIQRMWRIWVICSFTAISWRKFSYQTSLSLTLWYPAITCFLSVTLSPVTSIIQIKQSIRLMPRQTADTSVTRLIITALGWNMLTARWLSVVATRRLWAKMSMHSIVARICQNGTLTMIKLT